MSLTTDFPHLPDRSRWISSLDHIVLILVFILVSFPMARLPWGFGGRGLNVEAPLEIAIAVILAVRIVLGRSTRNYMPFLLFLNMSLLYLAFSVSFLAIPFTLAILHWRAFFPFLIACLFLWAGTSIQPSRVLFGLTLTLGLSAMLIIWIHYFAPNLILMAYPDQYEMYSGLISWGRTFWRSGAAVYFVLVAIFFLRLRGIIAKSFLIIAVIASFFGLLSTSSRTHSVAIIVLAILYLFYALKRRGFRNLQWVFLTIVLLVIFGKMFISAVGLQDLLYARAMSVAKGTVLLSSDFATRKIMYNDYLERLSNYFLLGQGLGVPFSMYPVATFYSDVTLVSFGLTFGIIGLFSFGLFVYTILKELARVKNPYEIILARAIILLTVVLLAVSLNDDVWSRHPFVIYLSFVVVSLQKSENNYRKWRMSHGSSYRVF